MDPILAPKSHGPYRVLSQVIAQLHISWENWWKEVREECMQLCERRVESWRNWTRGDVQKLQNSFFVVGMGTFQHLFRRPKKIKAFDASTEEVLEEIDFGQLVRDGGLAEELLARFSEPIFVAAPSYSDFCAQIERIHSEAGIPLSQTQKYSLASQAVQSGKAVRWLEDYASSLLLSRIQTKRMPAVITIGAAYTRQKPWSPEEIE